MDESLAQWADEAIKGAEVARLDQGRVFAHVPVCLGAVATGEDEPAARAELRGVLMDWARIGLEHGASIPVIGGVDVNVHRNAACIKAGHG